MNHTTNAFNYTTLVENQIYTHTHTQSHYHT